MVLNGNLIENNINSLASALLLWTGASKSMLDFYKPMVKAATYFNGIELEKLIKNEPQQNINDYMDLLSWNLSLYIRAMDASQKEMTTYIRNTLREFFDAVGADNSSALDDFYRKKLSSLQTLVLDYPKVIKAIRSEYGFHLEQPGYAKVAETDRMLLIQVLPNNPAISVNAEMKPVLIAHPYVLGANILSFLPEQNRSFVHAFANQGIPTYVRLIKDIQANPAVQVMNGEQDVLDTREFARTIYQKHGKKLTAVGVCQGGFILLSGLLTGQLDEYVDALITCASPIDGTRSKGLKGYLDEVNSRFRELEYSVKTLPNGNQVVDGDVMSWVYKLKSVEKEAPLFTFFRDLNGFEKNAKISQTAAAISYWIYYDRTDLPVAITNLSTLSYNVPISAAGDLPFTLFGKKLNIKRLEGTGVKYLICYGANDELVEPASALAPADYIKVETTEFPKGHAAIFTSWSDPDSEYGLHKTYPNGERGPVRFHLDLDASADKAMAVDY